MDNLPRGSRKLAHGTPCHCGTCGSPGIWDDMQHNKEPNLAIFDSAVWYNPHIPGEEEGQGSGGIECYECYLK